MTANRFGLKRAIPAHTKRVVRQRCGFGCVVCGDAIVEYHHMRVDYADATHHDPAIITLLCGACHSKVTRGVWSNEKIEEHNAKPFCIENDGALGSLDIGSDSPTIYFASSEFVRCRIPVRVHDYPLVVLNAPESANGPVQVSALFTNSQGAPSLIISKNEIVLRSDNWDATASGKRIQIWEAEKKPNLLLTIDPRRSITIERIESKMLGWEVSGNQARLDTINPQGVRRSYLGNYIEDAKVGIQLGAPSIPI